MSFTRVSFSLSAFFTILDSSDSTMPSLSATSAMANSSDLEKDIL